MTKHEQILKYIEGLPVGEKISVRQVAKDLGVSEGTAYRAIKDAENNNSLKHVASTYDLQNHVLRDGISNEGKKVITFSNILNHEVFPLADILQKLLELGQKEMNNPVEIEFAVNMDTPSGSPSVFNFLQIRPIVTSDQKDNINIDNIKLDSTILFSTSALGNGIIEDVSDLVYVKPENFKPSESKKIALEIEKVNQMLLEKKSNYILVGPGRWGSKDPFLGIPVKWIQISQARLIVESGLENFRIDPSQGTHFFQNLTSFRIGYFTINPYLNDGYYDLDYLNDNNAYYEGPYVRAVNFELPVKVVIDGTKNKGAVFKMEK